MAWCDGDVRGTRQGSFGSGGGNHDVKVDGSVGGAKCDVRPVEWTVVIGVFCVVGVRGDDLFVHGSVPGDQVDEFDHDITQVVVAAYSEWPEFAGEGVVQVYVVRAVACLVCGASVTLGGLGCVWLVQAYFGSCSVLGVGEWGDVIYRCVEPCTSPDSAGGVVHTHASSVECVRAGGRVEFPDEGGEVFLLVFLGCGVRCDFCEV